LSWGIRGGEGQGLCGEVEVKPLAIAKKYFPKASKSWLEFIIWEKTGYPAFFKGNAAKEFEHQLATYKRALDLGRDVCYCCGKIRFRSQMDFGMCMVGVKMMNDAREKRKQ